MRSRIPHNWQDLFSERAQEESSLHQHAMQDQSHCFSSYNDGAAELEYLNLLHAMVLAMKPSEIWETGTYLGHSALVMAHALWLNDRRSQKVITIENRASMAAQAEERLCQWLDLRAMIDIIVGDSLEVLPKLEICVDCKRLIFLDSDLLTRLKEFELCRVQPGDIVAIHDTSRYRNYERPEVVEAYQDGLDELAERYNCIEFPLSRGMRLFSVRARP